MQIDEQAARRGLAGRSPALIGEEGTARYAVLVALVDTAQGPAVLFEKRALTLARQPGEVCLPGGRQEPGESALQCAVRETAEELLIEQSQIKIWGSGDRLFYPFRQSMEVFIGKLRGYSFTFNTAEVAEVFTVPLDFFVHTPPQVYQNRIANRPAEDFPLPEIPGGERFTAGELPNPTLVYRYKGRVIWGFTARVVHSAVQLLQKAGYFTL